MNAVVLAQKPSATSLHLLQMSLEAHKVGLSPMERSNLLYEIREENGWTVGELAEHLNMKQPVVSKLLALQKLDVTIQSMIHAGTLDVEGRGAVGNRRHCKNGAS